MGVRLRTPYLPTVNAMALPAPMGASSMTIPIILKKALDRASNTRRTGCAASRMDIRARPVKIANRRTWSRSPPPVKASVNVLGMMCSRNSTADWSLACWAYLATAPASSVAGSTLNPRPGFRPLTINSPMTRDKVETTSKYAIAFSATRPTCLP